MKQANGNGTSGPQPERARSGAEVCVEPIIETPAVRLSMDETRILLRVMAAGKPILGDYHFAALAEIGILKRIEVPEEKDTARRVEECWQRAKAGLRAKDSDEVHQAMHDLERLNTDRHRENSKYLYSLSELGKQIARGISIRMNSLAVRR